MNFHRIRAAALTTLATITLVGMAVAGAGAADPVIHNLGASIVASVIHVSGTDSVSQTIHTSSANASIFVGLGHTQIVHASAATGGVSVDLASGN